MGGFLMSNQATIDHATIDHALGHHVARYFGEGHKGAAYRFTPVSHEPDRVTGTGAVTHDGLWSHKESGVVSRHLSTIDAVVLSVQALETVLGSGPAPLPSLFVTDLVIRAGSSAVEDLSRIEVQAQARWDADAQTFVCATVVGTMKLELRVRPLMVTPRPAAAVSGPQFYCDHLKGRTQHITDLSIQCDGDASGRMSAVLGELYSVEEDHQRYSGLQSAHAHLISVAEAIVCLAQLAQVMAYEHDRVDRSESANFWLRRLEVHLAEPYLEIGRLTQVDVEIVKANKVRLNGATWRSLRLEAAASAFTAVADVAHQIPGEEA